LRTGRKMSRLLHEVSRFGFKNFQLNIVHRFGFKKFQLNIVHRFGFKKFQLNIVHRFGFKILNQIQYIGNALMDHGQHYQLDNNISCLSKCYFLKHGLTQWKKVFG
jgi:hypothetical protein